MVGQALNCQEIIESILLHVEVQASHYHHMGTIVMVEQGVEFLRQEV